jgi:hypothetical protein
MQLHGIAQADTLFLRFEAGQPMEEATL